MYSAQRGTLGFRFHVKGFTYPAQTARQINETFNSVSLMTRGRWVGGGEGRGRRRGRREEGNGSGNGRDKEKEEDLFLGGGHCVCGVCGGRGKGGG